MARQKKMADYKENKLKGEGKIAFKNMASDMCYIGTCTCGGPIISYLGSKPENRFNAYCLDCNSVSDVRMPKKGDLYHTEGFDNPLQVLVNMYKQFKNIELSDTEIENTPFSPLVNELHGAVNGDIERGAQNI